MIRISPAGLIAAMFVAQVLGAAAGASYWIVAALLLLYGFLVPADVGAINAGVVENAETGRQGAALALHSIFGFTGAFLGPVIFGAALDWSGGETVARAWIVAFAVFAAMIALWPLGLGIARLRPR